jgi:hypothetical protein
MVLALTLFCITLPAYAQCRRNNCRRVFVKPVAVVKQAAVIQADVVAFNAIQLSTRTFNARGNRADIEVNLQLAVPTYGGSYVGGYGGRTTNPAERTVAPKKDDSGILKRLADSVDRMTGILERHDKELREIRGKSTRPLESKKESSKISPKEELKEEDTENVINEQALKIYSKSCNICHLKGSTGSKFVLMESASKRGKLTADEFKKFTRHLSRQTMPPPDNKKGVKALTDEEAAVLFADMSNFEVRKEEE